MEESKNIRLQKYMAEKGYASRRESERLILEGAVKVNGEVVTKMGIKVDPEKDTIEVSEKVLSQKKSDLVYIALHKPKGYVTTTHKTEFEPDIILDLLKDDVSQRVFPVGRLDKETSGLLILTNDGDLAFRLTHPKFEHEKEYLVETMNDITSEMLQKLKEGLPILGQKTLPPEITKLTKRRMLITLKEGKNRHIRRLLRKVGTGVQKLKRVRIGNYHLDPLLSPGEYIFLSPEDVQKLVQGSEKD